MIQYFKSLPGFAGVLAIFMSVSCNEPNTAGLVVLPPSDMLYVGFTDTTTVEAFTVPEDSLTATNNSMNLAGTLIDPVFGLTRAGFFAQMVPLKFSPDFGIEPKADSVLLTLGYAGSYPDSTVAPVPQVFNVYKIDQDLFRDSLYYSNDSIKYSTLLGTGTVLAGSGDTVVTIRLDTALFRSLILGQSGQATLSTVAAFQAYFKGIYVAADPVSNTGNKIYSFDLGSSYTRLHLYYHNTVDTGVYDLNIDTKLTCATVNHYYHDYTGSAVQPAIYDSTPGNMKFYIQSMAGLKAKVKLPNIKNFLHIGNVAINKAELVITTDAAPENGYSPAAQLAVQGIDSLGNSIFTPDYLEVPAYRGGVYDETTDQYKINITRYVQQVLTGKTKDYGLYMVVFGGSIFANRCILQGPNPSLSGKLKLQITYSLLN